MAKRERQKKNAPKRIEASQRHTACRPQKLRMCGVMNPCSVPWNLLDAVAEGRMGVNHARWNLECHQLRLKSDRIAGRVVDGTKSGPKPYLTYEEEHELVKFLISYCSKMGYGKTRGECLNR